MVHIGLSLFKETSSNFKCKWVIPPTLSLARCVRSVYNNIMWDTATELTPHICEQLPKEIAVNPIHVDYLQEVNKTQTQSLV